ncbi:hypothetical protein ACLOJK_035526 [Asimina triloba]
MLQRCHGRVSHVCFRRPFTTSALQRFQSPVVDLYLSNSRIMELARHGRIDEARCVFDGMPQRDSVSWNSIITAYVQNGRLGDARALFDVFRGKNVRTWTSIITGYARDGRIEDARRMFDEMPERNVVSWNAMISGYVQNGDLVSARRLFEEMPERDVSSWNSVITGYCRSQMIGEARKLFDRMTERNLVSWTVMISGYFHICEYAEAWRLFLRMHCAGELPDLSNFAITLSVVACFDDLMIVENLHTLAIKTGFNRDVVVGTAILNCYTRNGELDLALKFFEAMPERNEYAWTTMISAFSQSGRLDDAIKLYERVQEHRIATQTAMLTAYAQHGRIDEARLLFEQIKNPNIVTWNAMLAGYAQNGMIEEAGDIFQRIPTRNDVSWGAMIAGCAQNGKSEKALQLLCELHRSGMVPCSSTLTSALYACTNIQAFEMGRQVHALAAKGSQLNSYVGNGLITMYARCKNLEDANRVFGSMRVKDIISWNSLIAGLSQNCMLEDAHIAFEKMPNRDVVSWTAMISGYVQAGSYFEAMQLFSSMLTCGLIPNSSTVSSLLSACANLGAIKPGKEIHCLAFKLGLAADLFVGNALISMYFKCGCVDACWVFDEMSNRDIVTWNSVLAGCAHHGFGKQAVKIFEQMKGDGILPDHVSFMGLLCACSHAGLVDEGWQYFDSMSKDYGLMPSEAHYACMVDLLGRAGKLHEAEALIENMPIEPDTVVWAALLGASRIHKNIEMGRKVAERLFELEPQNPGNYILLSNIYASHGLWDEVGKVRKLMKDRGVSKEPGFSWMMIKNKLHSFRTGDKNHEQIEEIHKSLNELNGRVKAAGYVPDIDFVFHDVDEEQKENILLYHSEKLAVAYGLLSTASGTTIQIMKNLRICGDCHTFFKYVSEVTGREIDVSSHAHAVCVPCGSESGSQHEESSRGFTLACPQSSLPPNANLLMAEKARYNVVLVSHANNGWWVDRWLNKTMLENRKILNTSDLNGFDKKSKLKPPARNQMEPQDPIATTDSPKTSTTPDQSKDRTNSDKEDAFSDSEAEEASAFGKGTAAAAAAGQHKFKQEEMISMAHGVEQVLLVAKENPNPGKTKKENASVEVPKSDLSGVSDFKAIAPEASVFTFGDDEDYGNRHHKYDWKVLSTIFCIISTKDISPVQPFCSIRNDMLVLN